MKILIGMSGGLDSSVSVRLLKEAGHTVEGAVLVMHGYTDVSGARAVALRENIKLHEIDVRKEFEENVASYFASEYFAGRTPNPCTVCNRTVKIASLVKKAKELGFDKAATGHYADIGFENGRYFVKKGKDAKKDQSYMLWGLTEEQLSSLVFPLGGYLKDEVRALALKYGMENEARKKESQDICFLPDGNYAAFVEKRMGKSEEGNFVSPDGKILGRHKGLINYTVGQRRGLGIALGERMFVSGMDPVTNTVVLKPDGGEFLKTAEVGSFNFQKLLPVNGEEIRCEVKVRYAAKPVPCALIYENGKGTVIFDEPVRAVTPGQSAVFYDGEDLLCGAVID